MRCLQVKFPYTNNFSPWGGWFHLYLPVLLCRLETFAVVHSSLSLVQILQHDASEQRVCCTRATALGQGEQMAGGWGTPGVVCSQCVSPSQSLTKWMHCPTKTLDVYTKIRAWERQWICKGFVGLACVEALPLLCTRMLPSILLKCSTFTGKKAGAGRSCRADKPGWIQPS